MDDGDQLALFEVDGDDGKPIRVRGHWGLTATFWSTGRIDVVLATLNTGSSRMSFEQLASYRNGRASKREALWAMEAAAGQWLLDEPGGRR